MTSAEKKKLTLAATLFLLAIAVMVWYFFYSDRGGPTPDEQAAQEKVLQKMGATTPAEDPAAPAPAPSEAPAGRPRSVHPGH